MEKQWQRPALILRIIGSLFALATPSELDRFQNAIRASLIRKGYIGDCLEIGTMLRWCCILCQRRTLGRLLELAQVCPPGRCHEGIQACLRQNLEVLPRLLLETVSLFQELDRDPKH